MNISPDVIEGAEPADAYSIGEFVYFDIETIPDQSPDALSKIMAQIKPPATLKKPESIAAWMQESAHEAALDALHKTGLDGGAGHVCTIAWAKNGGEIKVRHAASVADEAGIIRDFFEAFVPWRSETLVGHNIAGFDIPFLLKRAVILGLRLPTPASFPRDPKPWDNRIFDTMTAWAGAKDRISMDRLCAALGIPGKDGIDGSAVAAAWAAGEHDRIAEYCRDDVARVRAIHQKFLAAGF